MTPPADHRSSALRSVARRATLGRSLGLLRSFPLEQSDPDAFYSGLARDTVELVADLWAESGDRPGDPSGGGAGDAASSTDTGHPAGARLPGLTVLDVGGGPGYFSEAYAAEGARYVSVEPDVGEMSAAGLDQSGSVRGSGMSLPIRSDSVDVCISSNVAEHVPEPWTMAEEMLRVTRPGGLVVVSYTLWYGPFGGHEMGMTHYLGGERARRMYERRHGHPPKNVYGESLFEVGCAEGLEWARGTASGELLAAFPRYHPRWAWWLVRVPLVREVLVSNLVVVLRAR
ncbi:MAG: class I SAM-dependent methyltransferase [Dietzia sp.]|uniref:class I SAM-dependent methyltransferase n=1 Tax=Dietzia TaxID=37914 RepID=UPI00223AEDD9|nr:MULTISPECIES: class I SAM-dependent methyltransferase [Dietzia]MCT1517048.1 class I SAM-dependent methyltransferase [Dietzia cercidiphylli]MDO8394435.1 class I SAM-dependent methyltransferase [Dietzia sp.]